MQSRIYARLGTDLYCRWNALSITLELEVVEASAIEDSSFF